MSEASVGRSLGGAPLLPPRFLFRFNFLCHYKDPLWSASGAGLTDAHILPWLGELDGVRGSAELRAAWSEAGIALAVRVTGKRQAPWCRDSRSDESDGLRVWIDTRDVRDIHRATRFCHQFHFMPTGAGRALDEPYGEPILINRAKEHPKPFSLQKLQMRREKRVDGYVLEALIPAVALTGFDPVEHPRLGFACTIIDRELGNQSLVCSEEFPYRDDPSLWATLELAK